MTHQKIYFTRRNTQYCNNTKQSKAQEEHSTIYCTLQKTTTFTLRSKHIASGPFIVSPRMPLAVTAVYRVRTSKGFSRPETTWAARGLRAAVKYFYERSIFAKRALNHQVQPQCWRDRTAWPLHKTLIDTVRAWHKNVHHLHRYKRYSHTVVGTLLCYTMLQDCNYHYIWPIATAHLL
jgi:hypothetical protein